jgi:hypothetical protein
VDKSLLIELVPKGVSMNNIIDLRETSPNHWQAKYQGNYGVYTVKVATDGKQRGDFSCSCPSDYYPCKHIAMVEKAIAERMAKNDRGLGNGKGQEISAEDLLRKLSYKELYDFTVRLIKYNPDLTNAVFLEFSEKIKDAQGNKYAPIIRAKLEDLEFDEEDYYDENAIYIDVLDEWAGKAEEYLEEKKSHEAVLIAQAYIEEFAQWLQTADGELLDWIPDTYQSRPFKILEKAAEESPANVQGLYDYCMAEVSKEKYAGLYTADCFNQLLMKLSAEINPEAFIDLQQKLLGEVQDKSSYEAEKILRRIIGSYNNSNKPKKAWKYVEENIQITSFRRMVVEKKIKQKKFSEAKQLIHDYIDKAHNKHYSDTWDDFLLQISQGEHDIPAIRGISYSFIKDAFIEKYYRIYKSSFTIDEWADEFEKLFGRYMRKKDSWDDPAADLLAAEGKAERLIEYIGANLSLKSMEQYYTFFAAAFPKETLDLFRKVIDRYAEENTGRTHYEHIAGLFRKMEKIPGGDAVAADMKALYMIKYKNRRAMVEILNRK